MLRHLIRSSIAPCAFVVTLLLVGCDLEQEMLMEPGTWDQLTVKKQGTPGQGSQIVFHSYRNSDWDIYIMNADGSDQRRLTGQFWNDVVPALSPNGKNDEIKKCAKRIEEPDRVAFG